MAALNETVDQTGHFAASDGESRPGLVLVFEAGEPAHRVFEVSRKGLELGRGQPDGAFEADDRVSRRHARVSCAQGCWGVEDLSSRNGTFVNGERIDGYQDFPGGVLIRLGKSLLWAVDDVRPHLGAGLQLGRGEEAVVGALLAGAWDEIAVAGRASDTLLVRGESGAGKELAARRMHESHFGARSAAPFVAVNCAAIPDGLAERLLFGAKRGAYSGAVTDAQGYVAAAHRGTLFLDEIAELDLLVQAKLLRVLESREVLPLGESRPQPVQIRVCAATHANLRDQVSAGRFRQDLYFRMGRPEVVLPPLRERIDELPWLICNELARTKTNRAASVTFVEACALRSWPGNVRELLREVRLSAHAKLDTGTSLLDAEHLPPDAGRSIRPHAVETTTTKRAEAPTEQQIESALTEHQGNVTRAAKALGLHRNQLRRWLAKRDSGL